MESEYETFMEWFGWSIVLVLVLFTIYLIKIRQKTDHIIPEKTRKLFFKNDITHWSVLLDTEQNKDSTIFHSLYALSEGYKYHYWKMSKLTYRRRRKSNKCHYVIVTCTFDKHGECEGGVMPANSSFEVKNTQLLYNYASEYDNDFSTFPTAFSMEARNISDYIMSMYGFPNWEKKELGLR